MARLASLTLLLLLAVACKSQPVVPKHETKQEASQAAAGDAAVEAGPPTIEAEIAAICEALVLPALGAAAWRDGTPIAKVVVGVRKLGDASAKATGDDRWHLGSNTKAMTALLAGVLVDRKTIKWSDTIGATFSKDKVHPEYKGVTLAQLLHHEGGAPETPPDAAWKQLWADGVAPDARLKFVRSVFAAPPAQKPGTFIYSNAGYMIAGAMLEAKTGKRWEELIRTELFEKLGMTSCGFGAPGSKSVVDQPWGHDAGGTPIAPGPAGDNPPGVGPAGTVHCTLDDYGKFLNVFATGAPALVTPETMGWLTTPSASGYAGGWMTITTPKTTLLVHSGSNTMWYAMAVVGPKTKVAFAVVTNKGEDRLEEHLENLIRILVK